MTHRFRGFITPLMTTVQDAGSDRDARCDSTDEGAQQAPVLRRMARLRMDGAVGLTRWSLLLAVAAAGCCGCPCR